MTWTIWYDSYYYNEGEQLPNVIGQYDTKEEAIEAATIIANKDMAAFLMKHENGWIQIVEGDLDDDPDGECTFTLGIRPDPENEPRTIHSSVTVSFRVIEIDIIPTSLTTLEE